MRLAYSYQKCHSPHLFRSTLDETASDFGESLKEKETIEKVHSWEDFEKAFFSQFWVQDFHRVLGQVLQKDRKTLSIGSCFGENEAPFIKQGYDLVCSDINENVIHHMKRVFGEDRFIFLDIFHPPKERNAYQDLLITGLDYAFDDGKTREIFKSCRHLLDASTAKDGRLLFTLRYQDSLATKCIDLGLLPLENGLKNTMMAMKGTRTRYLKKMHGFRRSRHEIVQMAREEGFFLERVFHGGYGVELMRSGFFANNAHFVKKLIRRTDAHLKLFNNLTLFEFKKAGSGVIARKKGRMGDQKEEIRGLKFYEAKF